MNPAGRSQDGCSQYGGGRFAGASCNTDEDDVGQSPPMRCREIRQQERTRTPISRCAFKRSTNPREYCPHPPMWHPNPRLDASVHQSGPRTHAGDLGLLAHLPKKAGMVRLAVKVGPSMRVDVGCEGAPVTVSPGVQCRQRRLPPPRRHPSRPNKAGDAGPMCRVGSSSAESSALHLVIAGNSARRDRGFSRDDAPEADDVYRAHPKGDTVSWTAPNPLEL